VNYCIDRVLICKVFKLLYAAQQSDVERTEASLGSHVLRPNSHADQAPGNAPEAGKPGREPQEERRLERLGTAEHPGDDPVLDRDLQPLRYAHRPFPAALHRP
jgi:hypothetical protein